MCDFQCSITTHKLEVRTSSKQRKSICTINPKFVFWGIFSQLLEAKAAEHV